MAIRLHYTRFLLLGFLLYGVSPALAQTITTSSITGSSFCPGSPVSVPFTISGMFNSGNVFMAELSNASGAFSSPTTIGSLTSTLAGAINAVLPFGAAAGTGYRIRVVGSNPAITGSDNGTNLSITASTTNGIKYVALSNADWSNPAHWIPCGVPISTDTVVDTIYTVTVPAGYSAVGKNLRITNKGKVIVAATATLELNGASGAGNDGNGIYINGAAGADSLINYGTINIGNRSAISLNGIKLESGGTLSNGGGGVITINNTTTGGNNITGNGIYCTNSAIRNAGTIRIGNATAVKQSGIFATSSGSNVSTIINSGTIEADRITTVDGIRLGGTNTSIANAGTIKIGASGTVNVAGLHLVGGGTPGISVTNGTAGSLIQIDNTLTGEGLFLDGANCTVTNAGGIKIGSLSAVNKSGVRLTSSSMLINNAGGTLEVDNITAASGILNSGTVGNAGTLKLGGNAALGNNGIYNQNLFTDSASGVIEISRSASGYDGIFQNSSTLTPDFRNAGAIKIGVNGPIGESGVKVLKGTFSNTGVLQADSIPSGMAAKDAITMFAGAFSNSGAVKIGYNTTVNAGLGVDGGTGTFDNTGAVYFGGKILQSGIGASTTLSNNSGGSVQTIAGGTLLLAGTLTNASGAAVGNNATGTIAVNGTLSNSGTVTNNGTLKGSGTIVQSGTFSNTAGSHIAPGNSPGTLTVTGSFNLGSATFDVEVNSGTSYDVLVVSGMATVGSATLNVIKNPAYTPANSDTLVFLKTGSVSGTLGGTLPAGIKIKYNYPTAGAVSLGNGVALPVRISGFSAMAGGRQNLVGWQSALEDASTKYVVERSADGLTFGALGDVAGKGNEASYTYADDGPLTGVSYYRLRIINSGDLPFYSTIATVRRQAGAETGLSAAPMPAGNDLTITCDDEQLLGRQAVITDILGKPVLRFFISPAQTLNVRDWPAGMYLLKAGDAALRIWK